MTYAEYVEEWSPVLRVALACHSRFCMGTASFDAGKTRNHENPYWGCMDIYFLISIQDGDAPQLILRNAIGAARQATHLLPNRTV